ncbi:mobile mystery protein A [Sediminibacterium sp.]|uniref:mobile mystery protein A n=1 Tax=Sediminibacterium sp. TaxID=1917865 RepID=UPI0027333623|nr:mobile mystery protein A [Sediminibacterium sp.]MDP3393047.1 mobile mystery protein A [Sediminibacterium sp.]MDP3567255.1 mobile mystery protein A [Sediminibacterium sp.]
MKNDTLQFQQLNEKLEKLTGLQHLIVPPIGWIKAIRKGIGMSMEQLGKKLSITKQAVMDMEKREKEGAITIKSMQEIAKAMDMRFVYGFVPNAGSLEQMIETRALEIATKIVHRTSTTMKLENQANSNKRIENAIKERAAEIINKTPKILWD